MSFSLSTVFILSGSGILVVKLCTVLLPSGNLLFFFFFSVDEQDLCGQVLNSECFSSKEQSWFLFKIMWGWHFTWGSLRRLVRSYVNKNKCLFFFLSPLSICPAGSGSVVWFSSPWKSHCALELSLLWPTDSFQASLWGAKGKTMNKQTAKQHLHFSDFSPP